MCAAPPGCEPCWAAKPSRRADPVSLLDDWYTNPLIVERRKCLLDTHAATLAQARLDTPTRHARPRRLYERRDWTALDACPNRELALARVEYRLALAAPH
ncbi:MAG: hypothetical protein ACRDLT_12440 [Solirubrobacteraceae bacterium]